MLSSQSAICFIDAEVQSTVLLAQLEINCPSTTIDAKITALTNRIEVILSSSMEIQGLYNAIIAQHPSFLPKVCEALKGKKSVAGLTKLFNTIQSADRCIVYRSLIDLCKTEQSDFKVIIESLPVLQEWLALWKCTSEEMAQVFLDIADSLVKIE